MKLTQKMLLVAASATIVGFTAAPSFSAETTIRGASCWPIGSPPSRPFEAMVKDINARGKGVIQVKLVGGAPAIGSPFTLTQKVSKGAYDIIGCTESYYGNVVPEAPALHLITKTHAELRKNGGIAYMEKLMNAKNLHFVARHADYGPFHLWLNKKIDKPDLKGFNLRVAPVYTAFFKAMGASVQVAAMPKIYTLMENNTVQGFGWPGGAFVPPWTKVTKFQVKPGFYSSTIHTLVNLKKWKSLNKAQQDLITKIGLEYEAAWEPAGPKVQGIMKKSAAMRAKGGMQVIELKGAAREKYLKMAYEEAWKEVIDRSPVHGPALKKLF